MFQEVLVNTGDVFTAPAVCIEEDLWKSKHEASNLHQAIIMAEAELPRVPNFSWRNFSRDNLRDVWSSQDCSFSTKYIVTLWWGKVFPLIFNKVFSEQNLNRLMRVSPDLQKELEAASKEKVLTGFLYRLAEIVAKMQSGALRVPYVGPAFFTKVIQFFFASHPIAAQAGFLPIIADTWLMRAVYCEMTDQNEEEKRDRVFVLDRQNVFLKKDERGSISKSYIAYIEYFNKRCGELHISAWDMEARLFRNKDVLTRYNSIIHNKPKTVLKKEKDSLSNEIELKVYDVNSPNLGKTLQILNNERTLPHNCDQVFVEYCNTLYEARIGSYANGGNTLRGRDTVKRLIESNNWKPGDILPCEFVLAETGDHIYRILE